MEIAYAFLCLRTDHVDDNLVITGLVDRLVVSEFPGRLPACELVVGYEYSYQDHEEIGRITCTFEDEDAKEQRLLRADYKSFIPLRPGEYRTDYFVLNCAYIEVAAAGLYGIKIALDGKYVKTVHIYVTDR